MVTLADVARVAKVSTMTVSKVLRGTGAISEKTKTRVFEAVDELGYVPNRLAGSLSTRKSMLVAVLIPSIADTIYAEIISSLHSLLDQASLSIFIAESQMDPEVEERQVQELLSLRPAFIVRSGGIASTRRTKLLLKRFEVPHIQIWDGDDPQGQVNVGPSHIEAGRIAAGHFLELGLSKVAYIGAETQLDICASRRMESFVAGMTSAGAEVSVITEPDVPRQAESGELLTRQLLENGQKVEGIFYLNDAMAIGGLRVLLNAGCRVPEDVRVLGFNGTSREQTINTRLTTISTDGRRLGRAVAESILDSAGGKIEAINTLCPLTLDLGNTT